MINKYGTEVSKPKGAIHKATQKKREFSGLMRNEVLNYLMQMPLLDFAKKNKQLLEFVEIQFGEAANDMIVEDAFAYQNVAYGIMNPNAKDLSYIQAERFGKLKETQEAKTFELPPMQDDSDIINRLDTQTLERILAERKVLEAPKEVFHPKEEFELISM